MDAPLIHCIYASAAHRKMSGDELEAILAQARAYNSRNDISGMLVYHRGSFLQVLEGPRDKVEALVDSIRKDVRHHDFKLLLMEEIEERDFHSWSMGFVDTTGMAEKIDGFVDYEAAFQMALNDKTMAGKVLNQFKEGTWRRYIE